MPVIQMQGGMDMNQIANVLAKGLYNQVGRFLDPTQAFNNQQLLDPKLWVNKEGPGGWTPGTPLAAMVMNFLQGGGTPINPRYSEDSGIPGAGSMGGAGMAYSTPPQAPQAPGAGMSGMMSQILGARKNQENMFTPGGPNLGIIPQMSQQMGLMPSPLGQGFGPQRPPGNQQDMMQEILPALLKAMSQRSQPVPQPPYMHEGGTMSPMDHLMHMMQLDRGEVPAILEKGEVVINKNAAQAIGPENLDKLNQMIPRYHEGDPVPQDPGQDPNQFKSPFQITVEAIQQMLGGGGGQHPLLQGNMPYPPPKPYEGAYPTTRPDPRAENPDQIITVPKSEYMKNQDQYTFVRFGAGGNDIGLDPNQPVYVIKRPAYQPKTAPTPPASPTPPATPAPAPKPKTEVGVKRGEAVPSAAPHGEGGGLQLPPPTTFPQMQATPAADSGAKPPVARWTPVSESPNIDWNAASKLSSGQLQQYLYDVANKTEMLNQPGKSRAQQVTELYGQLLNQATGADVARSQSDQLRAETAHQQLTNNWDQMTAQARADVLGQELDKAKIDNSFARYLYSNKAYLEATLQKPIADYMLVRSQQQRWEAEAYYYMSRAGQPGSLRGDQGAVRAMTGLLQAQKADMDLKEKMAQSGKFPGDNMMRQYLVSSLKYQFMINPQAMTVRSPEEIAKDYQKRAGIFGGKSYYLTKEDVQSAINEVSANTAYMGLYQRVGAVPPEAVMGSQVPPSYQMQQPQQAYPNQNLDMFGLPQ